MAICFKYFLVLGLIYNPILIKSSYAQSAKVLIRSTDAKEADYLNFVSENTDFIVPSSKNVSEINLNHRANQILNLQNLAETEFLDDDITKSINTYKKIVSLALSNLWSADIKQIIFQSYFRLAQLEKDKEQIWIQKAIDFAVNAKPDSEITPLGLSQIHKKLISDNLENKEDTIVLGSELNNKFLINGTQAPKFLNKNKIYRIDYITNLSLPFTSYQPGIKIPNYKISPIKFKGLCKKLTTNKKINLSTAHISQFTNFYVYSSSNCDPIPVVALLNQNKELKEESSNILLAKETILPTSLPLKTSKEDKNQELNLNYNPDHTLKHDLNHKAKKTNRTKTWVYVGSTILAVTLGAMFINQQNDNSNSYESTRKQGF